MKIKNLLLIGSAATATAVCPIITSCGDKIGEEFSLTSSDIGQLWGTQPCFVKTNVDFKRKTWYTVNIAVSGFTPFPKTGQEFNFSLINDTTNEPEANKTKFAEFVKAKVNVDGKDLDFIEFDKEMDDLKSDQFTIVDGIQDDINIYTIYAGKESFTRESKIKIEFTIKENVEDYDLVFWVTK